RFPRSFPGPAIALATSGVVTVNDLELAPGEAAWICPPAPRFPRSFPGPAIALATSGVVTVNDLELAPGEAAW
ncbi:hypothetical protein D9C01_13945, partial [Corynebacterium diphtheriae]